MRITALILVIVLIVVGGYLWTHRAPAATPTTGSTTSTTTTDHALTTVAATGCINPSVISPETDWKRVVYDCASRIWMDQLLPEASRPTFDCSFTAPFGGPATLNASNAELLFDANKDGTPETFIAGHGNNIAVTLVQGGWYKVRNGAFNGGFEIKR